MNSSFDPLMKRIALRDAPSGTKLKWQGIFWAYASLIPIIFYGFDAAMISSYSPSRAPNVTLATQLALMLVFYFFWVLVPRSIWSVFSSFLEGLEREISQLMMRLILVGMGLCLVHMLMLTLLLRYMHSSPGWGLRELIYSFGETCLGNAAIWTLAYAVATAAIWLKVATLIPETEKRQRYEARQYGKTWTFPLSDIYWIKAAGNYVELHTVRGIMMVRKSLSQVEAELAGCKFISSHRSALVNAEHVVAIEPAKTGSGYDILLSNEERAPLSRRNHPEFRRALSAIG